MPKIEYKASRTLSRFLNSDARVRAVVGPLGGGKSSACCMELLLRAAKQKPHNGVRSTRAVVVRNCYDDTTEILTEHRGWVRFADLNPTDRVAALHGDTAKWELPTYYYAAPYEGEMVGIRSQSVDLLVTPEHHLWVSTRRTRQKLWGSFAHVRADEIEGVGGLHRLRTQADFPAGTEPRFSPRFYEFLGFWFAEGYAGAYPRTDSAGTNWRLVVTQNQREYVPALLADAGFTFTVQPKNTAGRCANYVISTRPQWVKDLILELRTNGTTARDKRLPRWIIEAPKEHAVAFLRGFHEGDGSGGAKHAARPEVYHSASRGLLDDVQEMLLRLGRAATLTQAKPGMWSLTAHHHERSSPVIGKGHWRRERYSGMVYCVEVSTHVVLVRRNGRVAWCGQTYPELRDTTRKTFEQWIPPSIGKWHEREFTFEVNKELGDGTRLHSEILFRALDRPEDVKKLLSLELTFAYLNEARQIPRAILDMLGGRVSRYPSMKDGGPSWYGIWMDTNPWHTGHWGYKLFSKERPPGYELFEQPDALGPQAENLEHLVDGYYLNQMAGKSQAWIDEYLRGKYPSHDRGSIYGTQIAGLEARGAVRAFEHPTDQIFTAWDLGRADSTAIWFFCLRPGGVDVVDHYENHGQSASHYFNLLEQWQLEKGYRYVKHWLPHDARAKTWASGRSGIEQMIDRFGAAAVAITPELSIADGIEALRSVLEGDIRFHVRCEASPQPGINSGLESLRAYRYAWNESLQTFSKEPLHDASSHSADAARYMAVVVKRSMLLTAFPEAPIGQARPPATLDEHKAFVPPRMGGRRRI